MTSLLIFLQEMSSATLPGVASNEKFMVPVMVIGIIFTGITGYMIHLDRKIRKIEQRENTNGKH